MISALSSAVRPRRPGAGPPRSGGRAASAIGPIALFAAWLYLVLISLLGLWLGVVLLATGWRPVVIVGESMAPSLRVGDVLLVEDHPQELLGQRTVITFEPRAGEGLITHRIYEVLPDSQSYVTKGDANQSVDTDPVSPSQVEGVGRLVVPILGLPVIWLQTGDYPPLAALVILSAASLFAVSSSARRFERTPFRLGRTSEMASRGIRRVRFLAGLLFVGSLYFNSPTVNMALLGLDGTQLTFAVFASMAAVNAISTLLSRRAGRWREWAVVIELAVDTALAWVIIALAGGSGIAWAFIALPIVEAAVRFRLAGALFHWMLMAVMTVGARLYAIERSGDPAISTIAELGQLVDQLGILLLLVIPGAYLTEQLVADVVKQDRATTQAVDRAAVLERVAETGYELNRLGSELFDTMTRAMIAIGFDHGDAHLRAPNGEWKLLATTDAGPFPILPHPGDPGSGLQAPDLNMAEVIVDRDDPELAEVLALQAHDLEVLTRLTVSAEKGRHVVVRAANTGGAAIQPGSVDALRLLVGQAAVALQNRQLVTELQEVQVELARQAHHDSLTGLPNRVQFIERLQKGLAEATDPHRRHVVMFMDLDGFKGVNDSLGHDAGDHLLIGVAGRLANTIGERGLVARLGGDEFTVLFEPTVDLDEVLDTANEIHQVIGQPFQIGPGVVTVGTSIGVASAEIGLAGPEILRRADVAMYAAKSGSTVPKIVVYSVELDDHERRRGRLANEFIKAIERRELSMAYQPLLDPAGTIRGVEALLRWHHREMGPVSTATILELAESTERMEELTSWIMHTALEAVAGCRVSPVHPFTVAVNVTPTELGSPRLASTLASALTTSGLAPSQVVVELNERVVADGQATLASIEQVMSLGVDLALDDFGEGRTSLAHLRGLPISQLKLDRTLVQQAATAESDRIILQSVVRLAHELGFAVVAEGVETISQRQIVIDAGADLLQGYGLYRPMSIDNLRRLLNRLGMTETSAPIADVASQVVA